MLHRSPIIGVLCNLHANNRRGWVNFYIGLGSMCVKGKFSPIPDMNVFTVSPPLTEKYYETKKEAGLP
jgi:hypothetical protein